MAGSNDLYNLLRIYAGKQNTTIVYFTDFCDYVRRYAQRYVSDHPDLIVYLENPQGPVMEALEDLELKKKIAIFTGEQDKKAIAIPFFFVEKMVSRYKDIKANPAIAFPLDAEIPKNFPSSLLEDIQLPDDLYALYDSGEEKKQESVLYRLVFQKELPAVIFPAILPFTIMLELSLSKVRYFFRKEETKDYFLKKIQVANPGKELSAKNFLVQFLDKPGDALETMQKSGDAFYYWSQLCMFIRQDGEKVQDKTVEDITRLQAIYFVDYSNMYYRNRTQQNLQRTTALKNLELALKKPPYYFNMDTISKFMDSRGVPLLGQYSQEDLSSFLQNAITAASFDNLPELLTFKLSGDDRYYIYRERVIPLVMHLCSDARSAIKERITREWNDKLKAFDTEPEMKTQKAFEKKLESEIQTESAVLYVLLNSNFLPLIAYDSSTAPQNAAVKAKLFSGGHLVPYSELLLLDRDELYTDAKMKLPFWYSIPVVSSIIAFLIGKKKDKKKSPKTENSVAEKRPGSDASDDEPDGPVHAAQLSRRDELKKAADSIMRELIPGGSTLEREMTSYLEEWNRMLDKKSKADLTEDVNTYIRDYLRKIIRTLHGSSFTLERIRNLSETLLNTPSMSKIKNRDALYMYIQLYMVRLVKNL